MILVKIEIFLFACFWTKMGLQIMFADHPLRKKAFLEETISILHSGHIGIVSKGLTHDFVQKLEKFHLSLIWTNEL